MSADTVALPAGAGGLAQAGLSLRTGAQAETGGPERLWEPGHVGQMERAGQAGSADSPEEVAVLLGLWWAHPVGFCLLCFLTCFTACRISVPHQGLPLAPALKVWHPNHWRRQGIPGLTHSMPLLALPG